MLNNTTYDVVIVGGSYAGLSAAMALGRAIRKVLIIDGGQPCNRQTPHSHNFITQDGAVPAQLAAQAKAQVLQYDTVTFLEDLVTSVNQSDTGFEVHTREGKTFKARKILFATGLKDIMPDIPGFEACWGISALHCPYCHGYEVKGAATGVLGNGDIGYEVSRLISNWTKDLTLFTNGKATLTAEQTGKLKTHNIAIVEKEIQFFEHEDGYLKAVHFKDGTQRAITAFFSRRPFEQQGDMMQQLGCELTEQGFIKVDDFGQTTVAGVFAAGDNTSMMRSLAVAIAAGGKAGAFMNHEMIAADF